MLRRPPAGCQGARAAGNGSPGPGGPGGRGRTRLLSRLADTSVLLLGMVSVLALAEMAVRPFYPPTPELVAPQVRYRRSPRLGWEMVPDPAAHTFDRRAPINERGLRGAFIPYARRDSSAVRWVALGGSAAFGVGVDEAETLVAQAAAAESKRLGRPVEVVNAGGEGCDLRRSSDWLDREGRFYAPQAIVLVFDPDDLPPSGVRDSVLTPGQLARAADRLNRAPESRRSLHDRLCRKLRLLDFLDGRWRAFLRLGRGTPPAPGDGAPRVRSIDLLLARDTPVVDRAWRTVAGELLAVAATARSLRAPVYVVVLPLPPQLRRAYPRARWQTRLAGLCADNGFVMVDPMEPLREARRQMVRLYLPRLPFLNTQGHRIVGEALARSVAAPEMERWRWRMPSQVEE